MDRSWQRAIGLRRIDIEEDAGILGVDLRHQLGMLADQMARADIAGQRRHLGEEAAVPQHRIAALALERRHDDGAALRSG